MRFITIVFFFIGFNILAKNTPEEYLAMFQKKAIQEMERTGIPASITMAQGMLESAYGNSLLATKANNHFGIKCHSSWTGKKYFMDDDAKNECFRVYRNAEESYDDHSDFLVNGSRYDFLFELNAQNYKGWARGLKKAGYATNPKYPELLINLIEKYELHQLDKGVKIKAQKKGIEENKKDKKPEKEEAVTVNLNPKDIKTSDNYVDYIEVKKGDTFYSISKKHNISLKRLYKYNDCDESRVLSIGDRIYLQPKRNWATEKYYTVQEGDTYYSISQKFGIKLEKIYKRNRLSESDTLQVGQTLKLRGWRVRK
jgi:LysM repeat protein